MKAQEAASRTCARWVGVDVGGTSIKWRAASADGATVDEGRVASHPASVGEQLRCLGDFIRSRHGEVRGIGVVCPGVIDEVQGRVVYAANLELAGLRPGELLAGDSGIPVRVGHDGRAAGLAEGLLGAGRGARSFVMIPIGTGISAALHLAGGMWGGATFCAGEIGHTPVFPDGEPCACGQRGCLEVYASAKGIARRYAAATGQDVGARGVERLLGADPLADEVWATAAKALALELAHLTLSVDPERFVIGGGLSRAGDTLLAPVRSELDALLAWRDAPSVTAAQLGEEAGRWGALALASMAAGSTDHERWSR
ncbi:ROK family protein [Schaalia sp. 19OD2882]|uniref:ROK family protein n=1 Tax=Schaalia sp. 19OD2882 TaxID=2794089 RepID=UPI001C1EA405|nr:ROK family protein [Schaalia sp. 19OD2882]QWW20518.1 ROK family protein [Schaalia sp. 19OD2882]